MAHFQSLILPYLQQHWVFSSLNAVAHEVIFWGWLFVQLDVCLILLG